jgi:hypothetical protein
MESGGVGVGVEVGSRVGVDVGVLVRVSVVVAVAVGVFVPVAVAVFVGGNGVSVKGALVSVGGWGVLTNWGVVEDVQAAHKAIIIKKP